MACAAPAVDAGRLATNPSADIVYGGQTEQGYPGYVKLLPRGAGVQAAFTYSTFCSGTSGSILWTGVAKATLKKGHFHYERKEDLRGPRITLDGHVRANDVSGTWRVHFSTRTKVGTVTATCDSGVVSWTLPRDGAGGQVANGYPITMRLSKSNVKSMGVVTQLNCKSGDSYLIPAFYDNFAIARDRTFGRKFTDTGVPSGGRTSQLEIEFRGTIRRGKASGIWRMKVVFSDKSGREVDTCDSGQMSWSATA
jgi:hypothetical protein